MDVTDGVGISDTDIEDDDNIVFLGDLSREAVALAYIRRNKRRRALAREGKTVTRIEIEDHGKTCGPVEPRDGRWSDTDEDHGSGPCR